MQSSNAHDHDHREHTHKGRGLWANVAGFLAPHSHDVADSVDDALAGTAEGIRAVKVSLLGLGATALLQLVVVLLSGSVALLADTVHNFADAATAFPLWLAFRVGAAPPDRRYTYGFGRAEDLAGVLVVVAVFASAAYAAVESIGRLLQPSAVQHVPWVAAASLVGFAGNELVAQYRIRAGERIGSAALVADGYHARTDGVTSLAVLLGAAGVALGYPQADPLVGLLITAVILFIVKDSATRMWHRLMDAVDPEMLEHAREAALREAGVEEVTEMRARWIGHTVHAEAHITADCDLTLNAAHAVAERARHAMLHAVPKLTSVTVHVDPCGHDGHDAHADLAEHDQASPLRQRGS